MSITVDIQRIPPVGLRGTPAGDATIIYSGLDSPIVEYHIVRVDDSTFSMKLRSDRSYGPNVVSISNNRLRVLLPFRANYKVRVKATGGSWSSFTSFRTRSKQLPDLITDLFTTERKTARGSTVSVTNQAVSITESQHGVTVRIPDRSLSLVESLKNWLGEALYIVIPNRISLTSGVYSSATRTITQSGAFTGYTQSGFYDSILLTAAGSIVELDFHPIESKTSNDQIKLRYNIGNDGTINIQGKLHIE